MLGWFKRKIKKTKDELTGPVEAEQIPVADVFSRPTAEPEEATENQHEQAVAEVVAEQESDNPVEPSIDISDETIIEDKQPTEIKDDVDPPAPIEETGEVAAKTVPQQEDEPQAIDSSQPEDLDESELLQSESETELETESDEESNTDEDHITEPFEESQELADHDDNLDQVNDSPAEDFQLKIRREDEPPLEPEKKKSGLFKRLSEKLSRTRESFTYQIDTLFLGKKVIDEDLLDELEEILITADIGITITQELLEYARRKVKRNELSDPDSLKQVLKKKIREYILEHDKPAELVMPKKGPFVIMVVGVNGVGKTTTIGKIAHKFIQSGQSVLLVAGDTFRAAAVSQLTIWAERNGVDIVSKENADPSSVAFDAMAKAQSGDYDVVLVDTAGRLHTQENLMDELKKIKRVIGKQLLGAPHEVMLVIDATTGQNGVSQAKLFDAAVDITGITLTKLDGTAKGGIVANIAKEMKTPIRFIGIGEQIDDLRDFNADDFIEALFQSKQ